MTKDEIKAELRRSACEDEDPWYDCSSLAFDAMINFFGFESYDSFSENAILQERIFFLLVAEAL